MVSAGGRGEITGFLPAVAAELAQYLGRTPRLLPYSRAELYTSLERGEADIVLYPGAPPPGLAPYLTLSTPWAESYLVVLSTQAQIDNAGDFAEYLIQADSPHIEGVRRENPGLPLRRLSNAAYLEKSPKPVLILPVRQALLLHLAHPDIYRIQRELPGGREPWPIAMSKRFAESDAEKLERFLTDVEARKRVMVLVEKYLGREHEELIALKLRNYLTMKKGR